jgi:hypothetical protein
MLFDLQISICETYHVSPFEVRRSRFHEFCLLIDRLADHNRREEKKKHKGRIRRKANDNWF